MWVSIFGKWILLEASKDGGEGSGGGDGQPPAAAPTAPAAGGDVLKALDSLIGKLGGERQTAEKLYTENYELRQELRTLREKASGFEALGTVDAIKALQSENASLKRGETLREVAEVAGVKASVLRSLDRGAVYEVKATGEGGKAVIVRDGDKEIPFVEYATSQWGDFLPALFPSSQQQEQGRPFIAQHAGGQPSPKKGQEAVDAVKSYTEKRRQGFKK